MRTKIAQFVLLAIFLSITFSSCDTTQTDEGTSLIDVEQLEKNYNAKYNKVSEDLSEVSDAENFSSVFKKAALKHFHGKEKGDQQYSEASKNYDESFSYASNPKFRDNDSNLQSENTKDPLAELVNQVKSSSTYEKLDKIFDDFYASVKEDNAISTEAKNNLLAKAVFYEETLNFIENHKDILNTTSAKSVAIDEKNLILEEESWWDIWGECVTGVAGETIIGSLAGCGLASIPSAGLGCGAGSAIGAVGGALSGAADHCFE